MTDKLTLVSHDRLVGLLKFEREAGEVIAGLKKGPLKALADKHGYVLQDLVSYVREFGYMAPIGSNAKRRADELLKRLESAGIYYGHVCHMISEIDHHCVTCGRPLVEVRRDVGDAPAAFDEAWKIVKHKGPVNLPSVQEKVHRAMKIVEPQLLDWEVMHLRHEMSELFRSHNNRSGYDIVCKAIEDRIYRGIDFKGAL